MKQSMTYYMTSMWQMRENVNNVWMARSERCVSWKGSLRTIEKRHRTLGHIADYAPPSTVIQEIKLPTLKLESFEGNSETSRFWEQFESSVDKKQSVSITNKHFFGRRGHSVQ